MWEVLFWGCGLLLLYHYAGYPLLLWIAAARRAAQPPPAPDLPGVSLVISAYNEEEVLARKLENVLALDYPRDRLDLVVASDGSTDATEAVARRFGSRGVRLDTYPERRGKNAALNDTISRSPGEVVVFTDANSMYRPDALTRLVGWFADPAVGCVCGELVYVNPNGNPVADGYGIYWRYDQLLKRLEGRLRRLLGANGSIFAVRRRLYRPLPGHVSNDMVTPIQIAAAGWDVVYEPAAVCFEAGSTGASDELRRRSRIVGRGIRSSLYVLPDIVRGRRPSILWELWSRKLLRYATPLLALGLLVAGGVLATTGHLYAAAFGGQLAFYALAPLGFVLHRAGARLRGVTAPYYFCVGLVVGLAGLVHVLARHDLSRWETALREHEARGLTG